MIKLSVAVITFNEEQVIGRCLESVSRIADEILVIDSDSTDDTVAISRSFGAKVVDQDFLGFAGQRIFADRVASYDWVLMLDADEWLSDELSDSIAAFKRQPVANACEFPRLNKYRGKWIKHGTWYPDRKLRLYNKHKGTWTGGNVHEYWKPHDPGEKIHRLKGDLLHDSFTSLEEHLQKIEKYTDIAARDAIGQGKKISAFRAYAAAGWAFINNYFVRSGFLDGYEGFLIAKMTAKMSFIKYTKIRRLTKQYAR
jgi:glycosyltransferase involved in cell wall biosynthesis